MSIIISRAKHPLLWTEKHTGGFKMNNLFKLTVVGVVGYLVGFYEMKYKANKILLDVLVEHYKKDAQE